MPFSLTAKVIKGHGVGKTIGFPTANLNKAPSDKDLKPGVYAGTCQISEIKTHKCLAYFGPRHIFGETKNVFEVHILDFDQDIVGKKLKVKLTKFIRDPKKIKNLTELKKQLERDKAAI